jgi:hypothetical protein
MSIIPILVRLVASGELREIEPVNPVILARDVYAADRAQFVYGQVGERLESTTAAAWLTASPGEAAFVLEVDDSDEFGGFRWVRSALVVVPSETPTVPAPSSDSERAMVVEMGGRPWGNPRREVRS